ncbi:MAG: peptidase [Cyclobacteriaceae bacterium]
MTYCLGLLSKDGVAGIADTRITSGSDTTTAKKIFTVKRTNHTFFVMTAGLRSVRDKAITYFKEVIEQEDHNLDRLYNAVTKLGQQVKRVAEEDRDSLLQSGLDFNLFAIVGGQLEDDDSPRLYLLYPQGNWIEIGEGTPYVIIGNSGFGNPILKRVVTYESSLEFGMKAGFLSFEATRLSANDVDYPLDTVVLKKDTYDLIEHRFEEGELRSISEFWNSRLKDAINKLPAIALENAFVSEDDRESIVE